MFPRLELEERRLENTRWNNIRVRYGMKSASLNAMDQGDGYYPPEKAKDKNSGFSLWDIVRCYAFARRCESFQIVVIVFAFIEAVCDLRGGSKAWSR